MLQPYMSREQIIHPLGTTIGAMMVKDGAIILTPENGIPQSIDLEIFGAGFGGLAAIEANRSHAGLFNHSLLAERLFLTAQKFVSEKSNEQQVDLSLGPNVHNGISHLGRFSWDTIHSKGIPTLDLFSLTSEEIGVEILLQRSRVREKSIRMVAALGDVQTIVSSSDSHHDSWDYRLALWADHVTTQRYEPLADRMATFILNNHIPAEKRKNVGLAVNTYVKDVLLPGLKTGSMNAQTATEYLEHTFGATASERGKPLAHVINLIVTDAQTELELEQLGFLEHLGISALSDLTEKNITIPLWESYLRRLYIQDAQEEIFSRIEELRLDRDLTDIPTDDPFWKEFPKNTWWGKASIEYWENHQKNASKNANKSSKVVGMERARQFFSNLDVSRMKREFNNSPDSDYGLVRLEAYMEPAEIHFSNAPGNSEEVDIRYQSAHELAQKLRSSGEYRSVRILEIAFITNGDILKNYQSIVVIPEQ